MNNDFRAERLQGLDKPSVWNIMTPLAIQTKSVNLGSGFASWQTPKILINNMLKYIQGNNQYTRAFGTIKLVNAIAKFYPRFQSINPLTNILVTGGAESGLLCGFLGLLNPDEEVILFDPYYNFYSGKVQFAGGITKTISLKPKYKQSKQQIRQRKLQKGQYISSQIDDWSIDFSDLKASLNQKTKIIVINSPHNPTGKIWTQYQLEKIAQILKQYPKVIVFEDNVYQGIGFDEYYLKQLPKIAFLQSMKDRVVSFYSAGKLLSATGIRVGWAIGHASLIKPMMSVHQYNLFCQHEMLMNAVADCLDQIRESNFMKQTVAKFLKHRNLMLDQLVNCRHNIKLWIPKGGYFVLADISEIEVEQQYFKDPNSTERLTKDMAFCIKLAKQDGVVCIPCSSFYADPKLGENIVRFAYCKTEEQIIEAGKRLSQK